MKQATFLYIFKNSLVTPAKHREMRQWLHVIGQKIYAPLPNIPSDERKPMEKRVDFQNSLTGGYDCETLKGPRFTRRKTSPNVSTTARRASAPGSSQQPA